MRLYRNCSNIEDYDIQADIIIKRFVEKGYKRKESEILKEKVKKMNRNQMIEGKPNDKKKKRNDKTVDMAFLTGFNIQHKSLEIVIKKHWPIFQSDKILKTIIPPRPTFIYRNALDPPSKSKYSNISKVSLNVENAFHVGSVKKLIRKRRISLPWQME